MAHTVQSFIETLRADGVEAGRKAAEQIRLAAEQQAEQLLGQAKAEARTIIEEAEAQRRLERTQTDLKLLPETPSARPRRAQPGDQPCVGKGRRRGV